MSKCSLLLRHAAFRNQHSSFRITLAPIFRFSRTTDFLMEILDRYLSKSAYLYWNDSDFDFMLLIVIGLFLVLSRIVSWCSFLMRGVTENTYCNFRTWISSTFFRAEQGRVGWSSSHFGHTTSFWCLSFLWRTIFFTTVLQMEH